MLKRSPKRYEVSGWQRGSRFYVQFGEKKKPAGVSKRTLYLVGGGVALIALVAIVATAARGGAAEGALSSRGGQ